MTPLRQRFIEDMQLRGLSQLTQVAYVRVVRQPDNINDILLELEAGRLEAVEQGLFK